jgi:hypothetical protein
VALIARVACALLRVRFRFTLADSLSGAMFVASFTHSVGSEAGKTRLCSPSEAAPLRQQPKGLLADRIFNPSHHARPEDWTRRETLL